MAGRILADLGADVVLVEPPGGHPLRALPSRFAAWSRGQAHGRASSGARRPRARRAARRAPTSCIDTPGLPRRARRRPRPRARTPCGSSVTPFGADGPARRLAGVRPRRHGREREHVLRPATPTARRCAAPSRRATRHVGARGRVRRAHRRSRPGRPQRVDVSMQEVRRSSRTWRRRRGSPDDGFRGPRRRRQHRPHPRDLADARRLRVVRAARRQGARPEPRDASPGSSPRTASTRPRSTDRDWIDVLARPPRPTRTLAAIEAPIGAYFARHTMQELYDIACETNLMLAPANSPREILASAQLAARDFFGPLGDVERFPAAFVHVRSPTARPRRSRRAARTGARTASSRGVRRASPARRARTRGRPRGTARTSSSSARARRARSRPATSSSTARPCCGSSRAAGPTSCASTRSGPTTRTASRARRCTTGSTSASATSP